MYKVYRLLFALLLPSITLAQKAGELKDSVLCLNAPGQTYAVYLPTSYQFSKPIGVILLFDPGARGRMPVELYKKLADKYELILACSNNSRNGPVNQSLFSGNAVLDDVSSRFNIDRSFILASGFSGGGRTAVQMALNRQVISGVITCGAAFPSQNAITKAKPLPFAEVIGQLDMNYQEALTASAYLKSIGNASSLTYFYGGHQWPPAEAYEDAIAWHRLRINKKLESEIFSTKMKSVKIQIDSGHLYEANRMLSQMRTDFSENNRLQTIDSSLEVIRKDKRLKSEMKDAGEANKKELALQNEVHQKYAQHMAYAAPDSAYHPQFWNSYRRDCDKMIASGGYKKLAGLRLIDFAWRMCAEQHYFFLEDGQLRQAAMSARIWALLLPDRPAPCVQAATAFAMLKRKPETLEYLKLAVARGLKEKQGVMKDPAFSEYANSADFQQIFK
jgi:dienelactone hydrolase